MLASVCVCVCYITGYRMIRARRFRSNIRICLLYSRPRARDKYVYRAQSPVCSTNIEKRDYRAFDSQ